MPQSVLRFARCCAVAFPLAFAAAQDPAARAPEAIDPEAAWARFRADAGGPWVAQWHAPTGTPRTIWGSGLPLADWRENSLTEARRHAHLVLQRWPDLLGLRTSEFREEIGARMGRTWTFTFAQWYEGLPVIGGRVDVRIHMAGRLCSLGSTAWPIATGFPTTPRLSEAEATVLAWRHLGCEPNAVPQPGRARAPRLVIWGDAAAAVRALCVLAWEIPIRAVAADGQGPLGRAYVDAANGAVLQFQSDKHQCGLPGCRAGAPPTEPAGEPRAPVPAVYTVMGWTHTAYSPVSTPTNTPLAGLEVVVPGLGTLVTDGNGQFTADLTAPTQVTVRLDGTHCALVQGPNALTAQVTLQPGQNATIQLGTAAATEQQLAHTTTYWWTHRVNEWARSVLGNSPQLAIADQVMPTVNIGSACNAYYTGNSINFYASGGGCNNTASASVVAHEWGHGLDDHYGGISQTNGLSEGWGDICSLYLLDDPTIGHDFFSGGGGIRSGNNTRQYPSGGGVHDMGESWMGFAWKFRQNLRAVFGNQQALAISDDLVLGSIAANAQNQPDAVLQVFLADDDDGNLANGTPHHAWLAAACQTHSLPYPPILPAWFVHTPLANTALPGTPRTVEVDVNPVSGSITQVRVHWNDGQNRQRNLVPKGPPNRWHGLLPGLAASQTMTYHLEALHSTAGWLRQPAAGEYLYVTQAERRIWADGFENGAAGWTHAALSGFDEWQIGVPAGRSGPGWSDPSAPASGAACAGTDLGAASNGAYPAWSEAWLRSPVIDCTGLTGVRLRFRSWSSCDSPTDRLELRVAGVPIWMSGSSPVQDTSWTTFEIWAPVANNNPNVTVEFRVRSDGASEFGGWNVDDVELYSLNYAVALPATLALLPEQAPQGTPLNLTLQTQGSQPFLLAIGPTAGPTVVPGVPPILAGGGLFTVFQFTNGAGQYATTFPAPPAAATGSFWYSHVLTLDTGGALVGSNPFVNLFTQ